MGRAALIALLLGAAGFIIASTVVAQSDETPLPAPTDPASVRDSQCWRQLMANGNSDNAWDCVANSLEAADAELNRVYQVILDGVDPAWPHAENYKASLRSAQRAWIAFRDADCTRIGVGAQGDANLWIQTCYDYHTQKRIQELQSY
ncbi:MAG: lysozyme inhibitor LprI family protein [Pseudomonadota bacterium]